MVGTPLVGLHKKKGPFWGKDSRSVNVSIVVTVLIYWILPPCLLKVVMFIRILGANLSLNLLYSANLMCG